MTERKESEKGIRAKKAATEKVKFEFVAPEAQEVFLGLRGDTSIDFLPMVNGKMIPPAAVAFPLSSEA